MFLFSSAKEQSMICEDIFDNNDCIGEVYLTYDKDTNLCKPFVYKGCLGNQNRYVTLESCQKEDSKSFVIYNFVNISFSFSHIHEVSDCPR